MRVTRYLVGLALVVATAVFLGSGVASASGGPNCGDTVNGNVSLQHNLICPSTDGLNVGSNNTTIHLNGHSITCPDEAFACNTDSDSGIFSDYNNTVVAGPGTISGFYSQISLGSFPFDTSNASTVTGVTTNGGREGWGTYGVYVNGSSNLVKNSSDTGDGTSFCSCSFGTSNSFVNDKST